MKILILSIEFPPGPGGLGMYAFETARTLCKLGCKVSIAASQAHAVKREIEEFNTSQPFEIHTFPYRGPFLWEAIERFSITRRLIHDFHPDLILSFGRQATWLGAIFKLTSNMRFVATGIGTEFLVRGFLKLLTLWAYQQCERIIFISHFTQSLATSHGFRFLHASVIPLGADEQLFKPGLHVDGLQTKLNLQNKRIILTVGQISERKAQDLVIRALPAVLAKFPQAVYLIVGLPTLQAKMQALAQELGVIDQIRFLGKVTSDELPYFYNLADVFVLASRHTDQGEAEGFGIVALEAALCGLPAVVAENTGLVEAILPDRTGLVVPQESPSAIADALIRLLSNEPLRQSMGNAARQAALEQGTWEKRTSELFKLLQETRRT